MISTRILTSSPINVKNMYDVLKSIFLAGVASVEPRNLVKKSVRIQDGTFIINDKQYAKKSCYIVGFGKAVLGMAVELENILGANLNGGIVTVPTGIFKRFADRPQMLPTPDSKIRFIEGADNNLPDANAHDGALQIKRLVSQLSKDDLLIVLISGGGSALLPAPKHPITLNEKLSLVKNLSKQGADILEMNCVRKKLSELKGGGLAKLAKCDVVCLILSDVVDDPLDFIASGPTVPNFDPDEAALEIVKKYNLFDGLPESIRKILNTQYECDKDGKFPHVNNYVIGNNKIAALAAKNHAESLGYQSFVLSTRIVGNVEDVAKKYAQLVRLILNRAQDELQSLISETELKTLNFDKSICVIAAGEPTVVVTGKGKGGRNQELALRFSLELNKLKANMANVSFLSAGTDGIDGPTDASGAIGSSNLVNNAVAQDINPTSFLRDNDSYVFYSRYDDGRNLIKIGHTGTNVMDLHVIIVEPKK